MLVVIDASEASMRVLPAELLESGGSEVPEREEQIEADSRSAQQRWIAAADTQPDAIHHRGMKGMLRVKSSSATRP
jgi:hypothetical protein